MATDDEAIGAAAMAGDDARARDAAADAADAADGGARAGGVQQGDPVAAIDVRAAPPGFPMREPLRAETCAEE